MNLTRLPPELQLLIAEKLESRELSHLSRANHHFHSLCAPALDRLAKDPGRPHCPLQWAIAMNRLPLIQFLLSRGHDMNRLEGRLYSGTALHVAVGRRNYPLIRLFLQNPAVDLNRLDMCGDTALNNAIEVRSLEAVELLHAAGADLEITNRSGKTALLLALSYQDEKIAEFLMRNGADVNARLTAGARLYVTPLQFLVNLGSEGLVRLALEHGADPEVRNREHQRAVDIAAARGVTGLVDILREVSLPPLDMDVESDL